MQERKMTDLFELEFEELENAGSGIARSNYGHFERHIVRHTKLIAFQIVESRVTFECWL